MAQLIDDVRKIIAELAREESASNAALTREVLQLARTLETLLEDLDTRFSGIDGRLEKVEEAQAGDQPPRKIRTSQT